MGVDRANRFSGLPGDQHGQQVLVIISPSIGVVFAERALMNEEQGQLGAQRHPRVVQSLVVSALKDRVMERYVEPGHISTHQRTRQFVEGIQYERDLFEIVFGPVGTEPFRGQALQLFSEAINLTDLIGAAAPL